MKRIVLISAGIILLVSFLLLYEIFWAPNQFERDRFIFVSKGENFLQVVDSLQRAGIVRSRFLFDIAGRILELTTKMQVGKYRFTSGMSNKDILEDIRYGKTVEAIIVTFPEGIRPTRQAKILARTVGIDSARFMNLVNDSSFVHSLGVSSSSLIGYLMPMTYKFYWQTDEQEIIKTLVGEFWKIFNDSLMQRAASRRMSINDVLTMASIVEFETPIDSERAVIAGVYYNRLQKRMRLEADPTVQFILEDGPRPLHHSDLLRESSYNTYRHYGLPPGPINNPGKASILASLYPSKHNYLFFVATGQGGHRFSHTFTQHKRAIQRYRKVKEEQQATKVEG